MADNLDFSQLEEADVEANNEPASTDPNEDSLVKKAARVGLNLLPAIGATGGAIAGFAGGTAFGFGFGGIPGAMALGATGGAGGESLKQLGLRALGDENVPDTSLEAAKDIGVEGAKGAAEGLFTGVTAKVGQGLFKAGKIATAPERRIAGEAIRQAEVRAGARPASRLAEEIPEEVTRRVIGTTPRGSAVRETVNEANKRFIDTVGRIADKGNLKNLDEKTLVKTMQRLDDTLEFTGEKALTKAGKSKGFAVKKAITEELNRRIPGRAGAARKFAEAVTKEEVLKGAGKIAKQTVPFALAGAGSALLLRKLLGD